MNSSTTELLGPLSQGQAAYARPDCQSWIGVEVAVGSCTGHGAAARTGLRALAMPANSALWPAAAVLCLTAAQQALMASS